MKVRLRYATRESCSYVPWDHAEIVRRFTAFCQRSALQTLSLRLVIRTCGQLRRNDIRNLFWWFRLAGVLVAIKHFNAEVLWSIAQVHSSSGYHATRLLARHRRRYGHLRSHRSRGYPSDYRHTVCGCPGTGATPTHTSQRRCDTDSHLAASVRLSVSRRSSSGTEVLVSGCILHYCQRSLLNVGITAPFSLVRLFPGAKLCT